MSSSRYISDKMTLKSNEQKRTYRPTVIVLFTIGLVCLFCTAQTYANNDSIRALIQKAGNADSDEVRLDYLKQLRQQPGLDASLKNDLDKLITQIERWLGEQPETNLGREVLET